MVRVWISKTLFKKTYASIYGPPPCGLRYDYLYKQYMRAGNFSHFMERHALWYWAI